jgi:MFS family permease
VLSPAVPAGAGVLAWGIAGLGIGLAYATLTLVILETAPVGQEGAATAGMQLANALGVALGTGVGGALIAALSSAEEPSRVSLFWQDLLMIGVVGLALAVAGRLPGRPLPAEDRAGAPAGDVAAPA